MSKFTDLFISSYKEFKNVRCITLTAMFGAISIILGSLTIMVGDFLKIGFSFLPNEFVFYLFGPLVGAVYGAAMDILTFLVKPMGSFFPGFTISAVLTGILYGIIMYKRPLSLKRIIIANLIRVVFIDLLLNTYWLTILIGKGFFVLLPLRALKGFIMMPIETLLLYVVIKGVEASGILKIMHSKKAKI
ncbi:MAG: folate family ECF transporter S component [Herbinix sp.]|nr:folate family ECF transporter S component [Herbinix sp.]